MDNLTNAIIEEKKLKDSHDRYPIRFVFLPLSNKTEDYLFSLASNLNATLKPISDFFPTDKWITWESLFDKIEKHLQNSTQDVIYIGFSEYLRLSNDEIFESSFMNLIGLENTPNNKANKRRAYFIMHSFETVFQKYVQDNHHRNIFYNPLINEDSSCNEIQQCNFVFSSNSEQADIRSTKDYLNISITSKKFDFNNPIICKSNSLIILANKNKEHLNEQLFKILVVDSSESLLKNKIIDYDKISSIVSQLNLMEFLSRQIDVGSTETTFEKLVSQILKLESLEVKNLLSVFKISSNEDYKMLLKAYILYSNGKNKTISYLAYLFDADNGYKINNFKELAKQVFLSIKDIAVKQSFYNERKEIIVLMALLDSEIDAPNELIAIIENELNHHIKNTIYIPDFKDVKLTDAFIYDFKDKCDSNTLISALISFKNDYILKTITGTTSNEKKIILLLLINQILEAKDVEALYPQLFGYMYYKPNSFIENNALISEYLKEYRQSKIQSRPTKYLSDYFNSIIPSKFLDLYNDVSLENLNNKYSASKIFVLDGVGAEYLNAISYLLEKQFNIQITHCSCCKAVLPTTTDINKEIIKAVFPNAIWKKSFDEFVIHGDFYSTEKNIEKALRILEQIIKEIVDQANGSSFLIVADHGCTASHKIFNVSKKYSFSNAEHEGRCCDITGMNVPDSNDYIIYKDRSSKDWALSIKPISLYNTPSHEAHGGATIEETIVPYIYVKGNDSKDNEIEITMIKDTVSGIDKTIRFSLTPDVNVTVLIKEETGNQCIAQYNDHVYSAQLSVGKTQEITIVVNNSVSKTVKIKNSSGLNNNSGGFF